MPTIEEWEAKLGVALNTNNIELFKFRKFALHALKAQKLPEAARPLQGVWG